MDYKEHKVCSICKNNYNISNFYNNGNYKFTFCKKCYTHKCSEKTMCECGRIILKNKLNKHLNTKIHKEFMKLIEKIKVFSEIKVN